MSNSRDSPSTPLSTPSPGPTAPPPAESFEQLLARLGIESFDLVLVGDGSGSKWNYPVGWACVAILKGRMERRVFYGGANDGTVNFAELMAYVAPLQWYLNEVRSAGESAVKQVHILTDSQYAQSRGDAAGSVTTPKNTLLWGAFELLRRQGLVLHWHWIERETADLNQFVDRLSKEARAGVIAGRAVSKITPGVGECNPWE